MRTSVFNNPMLGAGLAELVKAYIGDPEQEARVKQMQMQTDLNQLQLFEKAAKLGIALPGMDGLSLGSLVARGGGGGGGGGSADPAASPGWRDMTESEKSRAASAIKGAGYEGADQLAILSAIMDEYARGGDAYGSLDQAAAAVLPGVKREPGEVIDPNDSWLNPLDWVTGPELGPDRLVIPQVTPAPQAAPAAGDPLASARDAIARGAPRDQVIARLRAAGIDPSGL